MSPARTALRKPGEIFVLMSASVALWRNVMGVSITVSVYGTRIDVAESLK
jgi:hypothetical protein